MPSIGDFTYNSHPVVWEVSSGLCHTVHFCSSRKIVHDSTGRSLTSHNFLQKCNLSIYSCIFLFICRSICVCLAVLSIFLSAGCVTLVFFADLPKMHYVTFIQNNVMSTFMCFCKTCKNSDISLNPTATGVCALTLLRGQAGISAVGPKKINK